MAEEVEPFLVKALQTYKSKDKTELSFKKGQTITVEQRNTEADTYFGFYGKHEGWFPNYYVVATEGSPEIRKTKGKSAAPRKETSNGSTPPPMPKQSKTEVKEAKKKAIQDKKDADLQAKKEAKDKRKSAKDAKKKGKGDTHKSKKDHRKSVKGAEGGDTSYSLAKKEEGIPAIIEETVAYLEKEDRLKLEGIFRVSGSTNDVKMLQNSYLKGRKVDLSKVQDPHTVAGVLKIFLREAKDPLLTFELYDCWVTAIVTPGTTADRAKAVRQVVELMPTTNRLILNRLIGLLTKVAKYADVNLMTVNNIAIVFAPTLLRPPGDQLDIALQDSSYANNLVKFMIEEYNAIFLHNPNDPKNNKEKAAEADEQFQKRMRRGSLALARGSIIGGQNTYQELATKVEDETPAEISIDFQDTAETSNTEATETDDDSEQPSTTEDDNDEEANESEGGGGGEVKLPKALTMSQMMDKILEGHVDEVDEYLATLPPDVMAKTKKELLEKIDAMMQSEEFKD
jgi:hypothetical protein